MGMHFGLIAVRAPVGQLRDAFSEIWPEREVTATQDRFSDVESIGSWKAAHERFVPSSEWSPQNPGSDVFVFCQDGPWALLMDSSYVLPVDEDALERLSERFGTLLSFVVESAGGSAHFWCFESGRLRRTLQGSDGVVTSSGPPLSEERGIELRDYFEAETEQLMRAWGLSAPEDLPVVSSALAISTIDRTDYGPMLESTRKKSRKPWWRFW